MDAGDYSGDIASCYLKDFGAYLPYLDFPSSVLLARVQEMFAGGRSVRIMNSYRLHGSLVSFK